MSDQWIIFISVSMVYMVGVVIWRVLGLHKWNDKGGE